MTVESAMKKLHGQLAQEDKDRRNALKSIKALGEAFKKDMQTLQKALQKAEKDPKHAHMLGIINTELHDMKGADHFRNHPLEQHFNKAIERMIELLESEKEHLRSEKGFTKKDDKIIKDIIKGGTKIADDIIEEATALPTP